MPTPTSSSGPSHKIPALEPEFLRAASPYPVPDETTTQVAPTPGATRNFAVTRPSLAASSIDQQQAMLHESLASSAPGLNSLQPPRLNRDLLRVSTA